VIIGGVTLEEVDLAYQQAGIQELVVIPYYENHNKNRAVLCGLITGSIQEFDGFSGKSAFLEHFIVLPHAKNKLRILNEMPKRADNLMLAKGIERIILCIRQDNPKRTKLASWAKRQDYEKYAEANDRDWYVRNLVKEGADG
jgi:hypothetical protein